MNATALRGAAAGVGLGLALAGAGPARAEEAGPPGAATGERRGDGATGDGPAGERRPDLTPHPPDLDFDLLGEPAQRARPGLQRALERRRRMLTLHTAVGLATWAGLAATTVVGQLDFDDRFRGGGDTGRHHAWHQGLAYGTSALFLSTALLGVLAPKPLEEPLRLDTALLHKIAMGAATAGMVTQIVLGITARRRAGSLSERDLAAVHQGVGYATLGAMTVGVTVLLF